MDLCGPNGHADCGRRLEQPVSIASGALPRIATIDERYQSYNIEMLEITGGKFWKP
jgi:hypothetical protein